MLFLDVSLPVKPLPGDHRLSRRGVVIGHRPDRQGTDQILRLPSRFNNSTHLPCGLYRDLSVYRNPNGAFSIIQQNGGAVHLILTSRLTYASDFVGNIRVPRAQEVRVLVKACAMPNTGRWKTLIVEAKPGDAFYVNWNRPEGTDASNGFYYVEDSSMVRACAQNSIPGLFADLGITPPFTVHGSVVEGASCLNFREWRKL